MSFEALKKQVRDRFMQYRKEHAIPYSLVVDDFESDILDDVEALQKQLQEIVEDMTHIPSKRLPLDKNAWLQEWSEVLEKLEKVLGK